MLEEFLVILQYFVRSSEKFESDYEKSFRKVE